MQTIGILPDFFKKKGSKMNRAKRVYRRLLGKKPKTYASSPTGSLPPSPIGGRSPAVLRRNTFKRSRMSLNRMWRRSVNILNIQYMDSQNFAIVNDVSNICWNHGRKFEKSSNNLGRKIKDYLIHSHGVINLEKCNIWFLFHLNTLHVYMKKYKMKLPLYMQI